MLREGSELRSEQLQTCALGAPSVALVLSETPSACVCVLSDSGVYRETLAAFVLTVETICFLPACIWSKASFLPPHPVTKQEQTLHDPLHSQELLDTPPEKTFTRVLHFPSLPFRSL